MHKAVMISIQPKWCELIANGKKTFEVRKTKPKLETSFKVYIYETQGRGQVVGYFLCDWISTYFYEKMEIPTLAYKRDDGCIDYREEYYINCGSLRQTCLTYEEFENYGKGRTLYGWHISNLVIYDKPKELSEFGLTRPPQSWCYLEE